MKILRYILDYKDEPYVQIPLSEYNKLNECKGCKRLCNKLPRSSEEPWEEPAKRIKELQSKIKECEKNIEENIQAIECYKKAISLNRCSFWIEVRDSEARSFFESWKLWQNGNRQDIQECSRWH